METKTKAPGLTYARGKPIWRASRPAIKAGFRPKWVSLTYLAHDEAALIARCHRLTAEMKDWLPHTCRYLGQHRAGCRTGSEVMHLHLVPGRWTTPVRPEKNSVCA
jgi:hypothetical protein